MLQLLNVLLFGLIVWWAGPDAWRQVLTGVPKHVLNAFLLVGSATVLSAARLQLMAHALAGRRLGPWQRFYHLNMTARAIGLIIPRSISTFAGKPVALHGLGLSLKKSVWSVLVDNLFDLVLLGVLAIPALLFLAERASAQMTIALALGLILASAAGLWWLSGGSRLSRLVSLAKRVAPLEAILPRTRRAATDWLPQRRAAVQALTLTLLLNAALAGCYHQISRAVGLSYPWAVFAAAFPGAQLSLVLAVTPGGLGLFDAGWYGMLLLGGVPSQDALTFVVAQRAYVFVFVLCWAGLGALTSLIMDKIGRTPN
jgi:uncharacterized protein (TIRG00374 family)